MIVKSFNIVKNESGVANDESLALINRNAITPLKVEEVFVFDVILCDNEPDRVGDMFTRKALEMIAEKSKSLIGISDHAWDSGQVHARLYDTIVVEDSEKKTSTGESYTYVLGRAYTLAKFTDFVDKIRSGILKECSISFDSVDDTCSICGKHTHKRGDDKAVCEQGHTALENYEGKQCVNVIDNIEDVYEWSFVAVPCQRNAGIKAKKHTKGASIMKKSILLKRRSAVFKGLTPDEQHELDDILAAENEEVKEDDVNELLEKLEASEKRCKELETENEELKTKMANFEIEQNAKKKGDAVRDAVKTLDPLTDQVADDIFEKIDLDKVEINEDGEVTGLQEQLDELKTKYKGLFKEHKETGAENKVDEKKLPEFKSFKVKNTIGVKAEAGKKSFAERCQETFG